MFIWLAVWRSYCQAPPTSLVRPRLCRPLHAGCHTIGHTPTPRLSSSIRRFVVNYGAHSRTFAQDTRMDATQPSRIFISAAEARRTSMPPSLIVRRDLLGPIEFEGLAGPAMREAGCECFHDMTARSAMALKVLGRVPEALLLMNRLKHHLARATFRRRGAGRFADAASADVAAVSRPEFPFCITSPRRPGPGRRAQRAHRRSRHPHGLHLALRGIVFPRTWRRGDLRRPSVVRPLLIDKGRSSAGDRTCGPATRRSSRCCPARGGTS